MVKLKLLKILSFILVCNRFIMLFVFHLMTTIVFLLFYINFILKSYNNTATSMLYSASNFDENIL